MKYQIVRAAKRNSPKKRIGEPLHDRWTTDAIIAELNRESEDYHYYCDVVDEANEAYLKEKNESMFADEAKDLLSTSEKLDIDTNDEIDDMSNDDWSGIPEDLGGCRSIEEIKREHMKEMEKAENLKIAEERNKIWEQKNNIGKDK